MAEDKDKKIIIDEDWKARAQKEKDNLAAQEKTQKQGSPANLDTEPDASIDDGQKSSRLPAADFVGMVSMLATQAFFALGIIKTKNDPDRKPDLEAAKYNIDMLAVLQEKTAGNLEEQEKKFLDDTLHQLRMVFIQVAQ